MNKTLVLVILAAIVVGGASWFAFGRSADSMMDKDHGDGAMMEKSVGSASDPNEREADMVADKSVGTMVSDGTTMKGDTMMSSHGGYESYSPEKLAFAEKGKVVLFFRASWCPTCRSLDADIRAHLGDIPSSVTILDVDYDNSTALKQKYGVTYQHTLVQVDANGEKIAKWAGSPTLASILAEVR